MNLKEMSENLRVAIESIINRIRVGKSVTNVSHLGSATLINMFTEGPSSLSYIRGI